MARLWLGVTAALFAVTEASTQPKPSEYDVKAAYLFNFGKFVRFSPGTPAMQQPTFDICIMGPDPMSKSLDALTANERINDRPVRVLRLKSPAEAQTCAIAYMSGLEGDRLDKDLNAMRDAEVLTVSDAPRFLEMGGMVQFVAMDNHVRFAINLDAVRRTHLTLSSELLRVAVSVSGKPLGEGQP